METVNNPSAVSTPSDAAPEKKPPRLAQRFFLAAHPAQSLIEMWAVGLLGMLIATLTGLRNYTTTNSFLVLLGVCGIWAVLRTRLPIGAWRFQVAQELAVSALLGAVMAVGLLGVTWLLPWMRERMNLTIYPGPDLVMMAALFVAAGAGYFFARVGLRLLLFWNRLRRRRLLWSITHAHLILVALVVLAVALGVTLLSSPLRLSGDAAGGLVGSGLAYIARFFVAFLPVVGVSTVLGVFALLAFLPPSALLSYFIARGTTRRLENLTKATTALRGGDYAARATVEGEDEVAQLQGDFNAMADALQGAMRDLGAERDRVANLLEARRVLVANVSHELRTPVATVRAALESSAEHWDETPPEQLRANLDVMRGEVIRLQGLIDDLFTLSRADAGGLALTVAPTDVAAVVRRMVDALAPLAWRSGRIELVAELPPGLPRASADEGRLEQVLANLLRNAIRHTPPGGIIVARASATSTGVRIDVCDTGEGIASEDLPRIWERFYRGANGNGRDGAGLGLALVKDLTEAMGGSVTVESLPGQGSCFSVSLVA